MTLDPQSKRMRRSISNAMLVGLLGSCLLGAVAPALAYQVLDPAGGEIVVYPGVMEGDALIAAAVRRSLSRCMDLGGWAIAVPDRDNRSEFFLTSEIRYGLWYCCIPDYYLNYLYFSAGAGSYSRMGLAERENAFALAYGTGLRFTVLGKVILGAELKGFSVFRAGGREERIAWLFGCGLPL